MPKRTPVTRPLVTVILPVRNEAAYIERSIDAVLAQDYPASQMEVIIADGMSTDGTREMIRLYEAEHLNLRLIDNPGKIVPTGMNIAILQSKGEIIVRVDGHCEIARDYVSRCVEYLQSGKADVVGGVIETVGETLTAQAIAVAMSSTFGVGGSFRTVKDKTVLTDTVAFPALSRTAVERAGLYDEELVRNQDDEYSYRLRKLGAKILLAADISSRYYSRGTLRKLWKQYFQYGFWKVRVLQKHPRQMKLRQFMPAVFVASLGAALCVAPFSFVGVWVLSLALGAYIACNLAASCWAARENGWRLLPTLPFAFAALHFAYGFGSLVGLTKFWNRWADRGNPSGGLRHKVGAMRQ